MIVLRQGRGLLLCLALLAACDRQPPAGPAPERAQIERGRAVYNFRCYYCHGYSGDGKTLAATYLGVAPRNFVAADAASLSREAILSAVRDGRPNSPMKGFAKVISPREIEAVTDFVFYEFVLGKKENTRYHTPENGWPNHERYRSAYPFALGEVALTAPTDQLGPELMIGRRLFMESCISCHDRGRLADDPVVWDRHALSYPRNNYDHRNPVVDAATSATPFRLHDVPPTLVNASPSQRQGEKLFQENCAFCHAADGTGKNWIGTFLDPHPRDLTDPAFRTRMKRSTYRAVIRDGMKDTSMPAWKSVLTESEIESVIDYLQAAFGEKK